MNRKGMKYVLAAAVVLVAAGLLLAKLSGSNANADTLLDAKAETIQSKLEAMGVRDAEFVGNFTYDFPQLTTGKATEETYDLYRSETTGCEYYFDSTLGVLEEIRNPNVPDTVGQSDPDQVFPAEMNLERQNAVLTQAAASIAPNQIGELRIDREFFTGSYYNYTVLEEHGGMETGTIVYLSCMPDGTLISCMPTLGSVFQPGSSAADSGAMLSQEEAITLAREAVAEYTRDGAVLEVQCQRKARGDQQFYLVTLVADMAEYHKTYLVEIEVHTGEILQTYQSW